MTDFLGGKPLSITYVQSLYVWTKQRPRVRSKSIVCLTPHADASQLCLQKVQKWRCSTTDAAHITRTKSITQESSLIIDPTYLMVELEKKLWRSKFLFGFCAFALVVDMHKVSKGLPFKIKSARSLKYSYWTEKVILYYMEKKVTV